MMGINMSVIPPDETDQFLDDGDHNEIFGTGNIGPDRIRMSMKQANPATVGGPQSDQSMLNNMDNYE